MNPPSAAEYLHRDTLEAAEKRLVYLLRSISTMLAIAFFLQSAWLALHPGQSQLLYHFARFNVIFFLVLRIVLAKIDLPGHWAGFVAGASCLLANLYGLLDLHSSDSPWPTSQMLIVILVAGFVFASRAWFAALLIFTIGGWFAVAFPRLSDESWVQMGGALLLTTIWSLWFLEMRLRSFSEFERKSAEADYQRVVEETRFFTKTAKATERWCPLCKASPDAIIRHKGEKVIDANSSAEKLLGYSKLELEGVSLPALFAPEERDKARKAVLTENFQLTESVAFRKDNLRLSVDVLNGNISKEPAGMMALVLRDASERDRAKERVAAATQRAQQLLRRQSDLAALAAMSDAPKNIDTILVQIVEASHRALNPTVGVFLIRKEDQNFTVTASSAPGRLDTERLGATDDKKNLVQWLAKKNEPLIISNVVRDAHHVRPLYPPASVEAFAAIPLIGPAGLIGILLILENAPREFTPPEIEFLAILAHRAATSCLLSSSSLAR